VRAGCVKPALFYNRGNLLRDAGRLTEAIASYDMALRLDPAYPEALRAGGLILSDLGHHASARNRGKFPGGRGSQRLESVIQAMNDSAAA